MLALKTSLAALFLIVNVRSFPAIVADHDIEPASSPIPGMVVTGLPVEPDRKNIAPDAPDAPPEIIAPFTAFPEVEYAMQRASKNNVRLAPGFVNVRTVVVAPAAGATLHVVWLINFLNRTDM